MDLETICSRLAARVATRIEGEPPPVRAGLALILRDAGAGIEALFIRRTQRADDPWSGHMALPGGRFDPLDQDLEATARREAFEEVGLTLESPIGRLDESAGAYGRLALAAPFVFALRGPVDLRLDPVEVDAAFWIDLSHFAEPAHATLHPHERAGVIRRFPGTRYGDDVIWGLTYRVFAGFLEAVGAPMARIAANEDS
jgi:8-oxo-dGTP pyrophosphatase MutT (NUDIX family)